MSFTDEELKEYIIAFFENNDMLPPVNTISLRFRTNSYVVDTRLKRLENLGFIKKNSINKYMFPRG